MTGRVIGTISLLLLIGAVGAFLYFAPFQLPPQPIVTPPPATTETSIYSTGGDRADSDRS